MGPGAHPVTREWAADFITAEAPRPQRDSGVFLCVLRGSAVDVASPYLQGADPQDINNSRHLLMRLDPDITGDPAAVSGKEPET